jgi:hypothetical protein
MRLISCAPSAGPGVDVFLALFRLNRKSSPPFLNQEQETRVSVSCAKGLEWSIDESSRFLIMEQSVNHEIQNVCCQGSSKTMETDFDYLARYPVSIPGPHPQDVRVTMASHISSARLAVRKATSFSDFSSSLISPMPIISASSGPPLEWARVPDSRQPG